MIIKTTCGEVNPLTTKDGSRVRELMHPDVHGSTGLSLAEAVVPEDAETLFHRHGKSEEIYHITEGSGRMTLGEETADVKAGDTVFIPSGMSHKIRNIGRGPLKLLCCCAPAYSHGDTELVGG